MKPEYQAWIDAQQERAKAACLLCQTGADCDGDHNGGFCYSVSREMQKQFPELRLARGWAVTKSRDGRDVSSTHWWLVAPDGSAVDPTFDQFLRFGGVVRYAEYDEAKHGPLPTGKCPNCGDYVFGTSFCPTDHEAGVNCEADWRRSLE